MTDTAQDGPISSKEGDFSPKPINKEKEVKESKENHLFTKKKDDGLPDHAWNYGNKM